MKTVEPTPKVKYKDIAEACSKNKKIKLFMDGDMPGYYSIDENNQQLYPCEKSKAKPKDADGLFNKDKEIHLTMDGDTPGYYSTDENNQQLCRKTYKRK